MTLGLVVNQATLLEYKAAITPLDTSYSLDECQTMCRRVHLGQFKLKIEISLHINQSISKVNYNPFAAQVSHVIQIMIPCRTRLMIFLKGCPMCLLRVPLCEFVSKLNLE